MAQYHLSQYSSFCVKMTILNMSRKFAPILPTPFDLMYLHVGYFVRVLKSKLYLYNRGINILLPLVFSKA